MASIEEKELEDFLMEPGNLNHLEISVSEGDYLKRQFNLGSYGTADIVLISPSIYELTGCHYNVEVIELKKDEVNINTLIQAARYLAGMKHHLKQIPELKGLYFTYGVTLVGSNLNTSDWVYMGDILSDVKVWTYKLSLESGIEFTPEVLAGYQLNNPAFASGVTDLFRGLLEPRRIKSEADYAEYLERTRVRPALPPAEPKTQAVDAEVAEPVANG